MYIIYVMQYVLCCKQLVVGSRWQGCRLEVVAVLGGSVPSATKTMSCCRSPRSSRWVVVRNMVPCWVLNIIRHLVLRGSKRGP